MIAWYYWYVFFAFYLDLREIDRKRILRKRHNRISEDASTPPQAYKSIPNLQELFDKSSLYVNKIKRMRNTRSLTLMENTSPEVESDEFSSSTSYTEESLLPTEGSMNLSNITDKHLIDEHRRENISSISNHYNTNDKENMIPGEFNSPVNTVQNKCTCSSSEDEEEITILISKKIQTKNSGRNEEINISVKPTNIEIESKKNFNKKSKKSINRSIQATNLIEPSINTILPNASICDTVNHYNWNYNDNGDNLHYLLNKNFELLDKMCRTLHSNKQNCTKNNKQKWLIFQQELECHLDKHVLFKDSNINSMQPKNTKHKILKDSNSQTENRTKHKIKNKEKHISVPKIPKSEILKSRGNYSQRIRSSIKLSKKHNLSRQLTNEQKVYNRKINSKDRMENKITHLLNFDRISDIIAPIQKRTSSEVYHNLTDNCCKYSSSSGKSKNHKLNCSILKPMKPKNLQAECTENIKVKELQNLYAYNNLTLEQDRREMLQKKKKSKMTSYKNALPEITVCTPDAANVDAELQKYVNINFNKEAEGRILKQFTKYNEFLNQNKISNKSNRKLRHFQSANESTNRIPVNNIESTREIKMADTQHLEIESALNIKSSSSLTSKDTSFSQEEIISRQDHEIANDSVMPQMYRSNVREIIERIDWSNHSSQAFHNFSGSTMIKSHFTTVQHEPERRVIADDETVNMLQSAFSFSDENERGFHLGPESNEPYPIFQIVALTMNEIFKSVGWRNFSETTSFQFGSDIEIFTSDDTIFCYPEEQSNSRDTGDDEEYVKTPINVDTDKFDELEERNNISYCLLEQLQELLKSSREALSAIENSRSNNAGENKQKCIDDVEETFSNSMIEYINAFNDLYNKVEHIKNDMNALNIYPSIDDKVSPKQDKFLSNSINDSKNQDSIIKTETNSQTDVVCIDTKHCLNINLKDIKFKARNDAPKFTITENTECNLSFKDKINKNKLKRDKSIFLEAKNKCERKDNILRLVKSDGCLILKSDVKKLKLENQNNYVLGILKKSPTL